MKRGVYAATGAALALGLAGLGLRRSRPPVPASPAGHPRPRVVIAGAGFAGVGLLGELSTLLTPDEVDVTLVDRNNYHLFTPLLYQVATASVEPENIAYPLRPFCHDRGARLITSEILDVDLHGQRLLTDDGDVGYDYLILGLGSRTNYFGMEQVEQRSIGLKALASAKEIRKQVISSVEAATTVENPAERRRLLRFAVVGAGATGTELVGSLHDLIYNNLLPYYPGLDDRDVAITLIEATDTILPGVKQRTRDLALARIRELGIDLRLKTAVSGIENGTVLVKQGEPIEAATVIWTAGVRPNGLAAGLPVEHYRDGRIVVDEYLRIPTHPNVFVLGDNAFARPPGAQAAYPPTAAAALEEGRKTAHNVARLVRGAPILPFSYRPKGELIALGRGHAAAQIGPVVVDGLPGWLFWRIFYLYRLMGIKNRANVAFDWVATIFSRRYIANTDAPEPPAVTGRPLAQEAGRSVDQPA